MTNVRPILPPGEPLEKWLAQFMPHVSIDCVVFGFHGADLKLLLLKWKGIDTWVLPGGFVGLRQSVDGAAHQVLQARTGLRRVHLRQFHAFGDLGRKEATGRKLFRKNRLVVPRRNLWLFQRVISIGYYAQQHETLDPDQTLIDLIRHAKECSEGAAVAFLLKFLFTYEQCRQRVGDLSGGERSRLQLALLMLSGANFLLLDEPTNNLDIASAEVLENALQNFEGTVLCVSHDRYFLDRVTQRTVELENGWTTDYVGGYSDYAAKKLGERG